jgi:hypothetical protein
MSSIVSVENWVYFGKDLKFELVLEEPEMRITSDCTAPLPKPRESNFLSLHPMEKLYHAWNHPLHVTNLNNPGWLICPWCLISQYICSSSHTIKSHHHHHHHSHSKQNRKKTTIYCDEGEVVGDDDNENDEDEEDSADRPNGTYFKLSSVLFGNPQEYRNHLTKAHKNNYDTKKFAEIEQKLNTSRYSTTVTKELFYNAPLRIECPFADCGIACKNSASMVDHLLRLHPSAIACYRPQIPQQPLHSTNGKETIRFSFASPVLGEVCPRGFLSNPFGEECRICRGCLEAVVKEKTKEGDVEDEANDNYERVDDREEDCDKRKYENKSFVYSNPNAYAAHAIKCKHLLSRLPRRDKRVMMMMITPNNVTLDCSLTDFMETMPAISNPKKRKLSSFLSLEGEQEKEEEDEEEEEEEET